MAIHQKHSDQKKPILKIGLLTDTHVNGKKPGSFRGIRAAMELFKKEKTEAVFHLGDLADRSDAVGYDLYRKTVSSIFGAAAPTQYFLFATHDFLEAPDYDSAWNTMRQHAEIQHGQYHKVFIKGFPFLLYPQWCDPGRMEQEIRQTVKENPDKPIFVMDHVPPRNTTCNSRIWGNAERRTLFEGFPQIVVISGHTHYSLFNELCIWQGNFTAVNAGSLFSWDGDLAGTAPKSKSASEVLILEIFPEKLIFRRYSVKTMQEICADRVWTIPLPFDPATAPYRLDRRKKNSPAPFFSTDAGITLSEKGIPCRALTVTFPEAFHPERTFRYRVEISEKDQRGNWQRLTLKDEFGNFYKIKGGKKVSVTFDAGFFTTGHDYLITVTPFNFYGTAGAPLTKPFTAPEILTGRLCFESKEPMKECSYMTGLRDGKRIRMKKGFFRYPGGDTRLEFPQEVWDGPRYTQFRFTADIVTEQPEDSSWTLLLRNPEPIENANSRITTPSGKPGRIRYVITFRKKSRIHRYYLLLREGKAGRVQFQHIKIEKISTDRKERCKG